MRSIGNNPSGALVSAVLAAALLVACGGGDNTVVERETTQNVLLTGNSAPDSAQGQDGQFYLDAQAMLLYGPRTNGQWPLPPVALAGAAGDAGSSILSGAGVPVDASGSDGDFYIDLSSATLYGPKAGGTWPGVGILLVGPVGPAGQNGVDGAGGADGADGAVGPQGPAGASLPPVTELRWGVASNSTFGNGTYYLWPQGPNLNARNPVLLSRACTQGRLQVATFGTPLVGQIHTYTVMRTPGPELSMLDTEDLALVCVINSASRQCDVSATVAFEAGDAVEVRLDGNAPFTDMQPQGSTGVTFTCQ